MSKTIRIVVEYVMFITVLFGLYRVSVDGHRELVNKELGGNHIDAAAGILFVD